MTNLSFEKNTEADEWLNEPEGQLAVDIIETPTEIIVRSAVAGVSSEDIDLNVTHDTLTIRGKREKCKSISNSVTHLQECYWGIFSRSIILPANIKPEETNAVMRQGILTIRLQKAEIRTDIPVLSVDDES